MVARDLGVSIRTLQPWDDVGVASPSGRTSAGYRACLPADIARLRRVLLLRELGVLLERIRFLLSADAASCRVELETRRAELEAKILRRQGVAREVDRTLAAGERGVLLSEPEQKEVFGDLWDPEWTEMARQQWGDCVQGAEYAGRSAPRAAEDWQTITVAMQDSHEGLAQAKREGTLPGRETPTKAAALRVGTCRWHRLW